MNSYKFIYVFLFCFFILLWTGYSNADECSSGLKKINSMSSLLQKRQSMEKLAERCSGNAEFLYNYAYILERLRRYSEAALYYKKAAELDATNAKYFFGLGDTLRYLGRYAEAVSAYKRGLEIDPGNARVKRYLEEIEREHGDEIKRVEAEKTHIVKERNMAHTAGHGAKTGSQPTEKTKTVVNDKIKIKKRHIELVFQRPYMKSVNLSKQMNRIISTKKLDSAFINTSMKGFVRRKTLDEKYFK